ncbi:MAG: imidazole glycerol phosphate synthase subunit HisH [Planctomycetaceae bacterium]|nr:imidazole glycerol phosphate synthase subunit HisH [Planctomycetaceae bacterium]
MIAIINYGMGNLRSVQKALERLGHDARVIDEPREVAGADRLILPGVGAFKDAMANLRDQGWVGPVLEFVESGRPFLGICLGLQLLFDESEEDGQHEGLGVIGGRIVRFRPTDRALKVPHMGWNTLEWSGDEALYRGLTGPVYTYFVHSYYAEPTDASVVATVTDYDGPFCSSIHRENVYATQFHPEKSQRVGLTLLENFATL